SQGPNGFHVASRRCGKRPRTIAGHSPPGSMKDTDDPSVRPRIARILTISERHCTDSKQLKHRYRLLEISPQFRARTLLILAAEHTPSPECRRRSGMKSELRIRLARMADADRIERLQEQSLPRLGSRYYGRSAVEIFLRLVGSLDIGLIQDRTYYVAEFGGRLVGCGGWSFRAAAMPPSHSVTA